MRCLWVVVEPAGQLAVLILIFTLIGRLPSYGDSFALFLLTGVVMLTIVTRGAQLVTGAVLGLRSPNRLATIGLYDEAVARVLFMLTTAVIYSSALIWAIGAWERQQFFPAHPERVASAFFWAGMLAFGVGLLRGYASRFLPLAERIYAILSRGLIFVSGVFFAPSFMVPQIREILAWNPVLHAVELMRLGMYDEYPTIVYDHVYLASWGLCATALGLGLLWRGRRKVLE